MTPATITISGEGSELIERIRAGVESSELIDLFGMKFAGVKLSIHTWEGETRATMIAQEVAVVKPEQATDIDWSKAPEWATKHGYAGSGFKAVWLNDDEYTYVDGAQKGRSFNFAKEEGFSIGEIMSVSLRPAPPWSGDGLPPVGTFVRIADDGSLRYGSNESGEVIAHVEDCAVVRMSYGLGCFTARFLEAIKTPAQIAAEEREAAIKAMVASCPYPGSKSTAIDCEALYDAGMRFPKGDDQ